MVPPVAKSFALSDALAYVLSAIFLTTGSLRASPSFSKEAYDFARKITPNATRAIGIQNLVTTDQYNSILGIANVWVTALMIPRATRLQAAPIFLFVTILNIYSNYNYLGGEIIHALPPMISGALTVWMWMISEGLDLA